MIFEGRHISELTDQDFISLIGNQVENLWIEFKRQSYQQQKNNRQEYRREICKDVTAMANAEGGYIVIGVHEEDKIAHSFFNVPDAEREAKSIYDTCHQYIVPRIAKLEIEPYNLRWQEQEYNLIVIGIPFSENRPHGFNSNGTLNFVKRYGDITKEFQIEEFIPELLARHHLPSIHDYQEQLDRIENQTKTILDEIGGNE